MSDAEYNRVATDINALTQPDALEGQSNCLRTCLARRESAKRPSCRFRYSLLHPLPLTDDDSTSRAYAPKGNCGHSRNYSLQEVPKILGRSLRVAESKWAHDNHNRCGSPKTRIGSPSYR